jgi:phage terminase small subunit
MVISTDKKKAFLREYMKDFNASAAAVRAGYAATWSKLSGWRVLQEEEAQEYLNILKEKAADRNDLHVDDLIQELRLIAFLDIAEVFDGNGELKSIDDMSETARRAISEFQINSYENDNGVTTNSKAKLYSKLDAIEKLMKYMGAYEKDNKQKSDHDLTLKTDDQLIKELKTIRNKRKQFDK